MKPIKCEPRKDVVVADYDDVLGDMYDPEEFRCYHYMPEFLEAVYDEPNAEQLKSANFTLQHYAFIRNELQYIGTERVRMGLDAIFLEYYRENDNLIVYLIEKPKNRKYYASLQMVAIHKPKCGGVPNA